MQGLLRSSRRPDLTFSPSGRIDVSARVARLLGLRRGDVLGIGEEDGELWVYARLRAPLTGRHEGTVYMANRGGLACRTWSRAMCAAVLGRFGAHGRIRVAVGEPREHPAYGTVLPIIQRYIIER